MRILIDANVPLNVWLADRPMAVESEAVLRAVGNGRIHGCMTSSLVLFVLLALRKAHDAAFAEQRGNELLDIVTMIQQPKGVFRATLKERWPDLEDGFQYFAAKRYAHPVDVIVTNNTKHFKLAQGISVLTPEEFVRKHLK